MIKKITRNIYMTAAIIAAVTFLAIILLAITEWASGRELPSDGTWRTLTDISTACAWSATPLFILGWRKEATL